MVRSSSVILILLGDSVGNSQNELYRVVFSGNITEEFDLATTKKRFAKVFRLAPKKVDKLFSRQDSVLKDNVVEAVAMKFAMKIADVGCECYIEPVPHAGDTSQQQGFVEQRGAVRRLWQRRPPRSGALIPDRRILVGRRREETAAASSA